MVPREDLRYTYFIMASMTDKTEESHLSDWRFFSYRMMFPCLLLMLLILILDLFVPLGVAVGVLYVVPVLLSLWSRRKRFPVLVACISSVLIIGVFLYQPQVQEMWKVYFNRVISLFATWLTAVLGIARIGLIVEREKALRDKEEALEHIKILKGMLPMCVACKKIRDDKGYWNEVAVYISRHSEAEFTHGLCQECAEKLYPQYFRKKQKGNDGE